VVLDDADRWISPGRTRGVLWRRNKKPRTSGASSSSLPPHGDHARVSFLRRAAVGGEHCGASLWLSGVGGKWCEGGVSWGLGFYRRAGRQQEGARGDHGQWRGAVITSNGGHGGASAG
jgi:hypothetical protein